MGAHQREMAPDLLLAFITYGSGSGFTRCAHLTFTPNAAHCPRRCPLKLRCDGANTERINLIGHTSLEMTSDESDDYDDDEIDAKAKQYCYKPPTHSDSFLNHLESVKSSWPYDPNEDNEEISKTGTHEFNNLSDGGVRCTGEPSIDPSRMLQSVVVDGEADWI